MHGHTHTRTRTTTLGIDPGHSTPLPLPPWGHQSLAPSQESYLLRGLSLASAFCAPHLGSTCHSLGCWPTDQIPLQRTSDGAHGRHGQAFEFENALDWHGVMHARSLFRGDFGGNWLLWEDRAAGFGCGMTWCALGLQFEFVRRATCWTGRYCSGGTIFSMGREVCVCK